jgi:hypothetical protein
MTPPACPGSLRPVPGRRPGDEVTCDFCSRRVLLVAAPLPGLHDPWRGSRDARVESHDFQKPGPDHLDGGVPAGAGAAAGTGKK